MARYLALAVALALNFVVVTDAHAVVIAGFNFDDNAFADTASSLSPLSLLNGAPTLEAAVTGSNTANGVACFVDCQPGLLEIGFTDNYIVNGAGDDLIIFEFGNVQDSIDVTINGMTITSGPSTITAFPSGFDAFNIYYVPIELSDFGVAGGGLVSSLSLGNFDVDLNEFSFTPSVLGALNSRSVPEPSMLFLLSLAFTGVMARSRRRP